MKKEKTIKYFTILFTVSAVLLVLYLTWQNFSPIGRQTILYNLQKNKFVTKLNPSTRINPILCEKNSCTQTMFEDPIYFDLLLARNFDLATISLTYQTKTPTTIRLGMQTKAGWNYLLKESESKSENENWTTEEFTFPLNTAFKNKRQVNFIVSAPELKESNKTITIKEIKFELKR